MVEITEIGRLDGSNYQSWKYNIKLALMERGLWGFTQGLEVAPVVTEDDKKEKEIKAFLLRSDKAYSLIALSIDKYLQIHITNTTDPKTVWNTLQNHFEFVSITQIVRLNREFYAATMHERTDLMEHLTHMTSLAKRLRELKEDISPRKFATVVHGSLPESYNFLTGLNAGDANSFQWDNIKQVLIEEYMKRKEKNEKQKNEDAMFIRKGRNFQEYSGRNRGRSNFRNKANNVGHFENYHLEQL